MGNKFSYFFSGTGLFVIAVVLVCLHVTKPKIKTEKDLRFFGGKFSEHHYYNSSRSANSCWFKLGNYSNSFVVDGRNLKAFNIEEFIKLKDGDSVTVGISQRDFYRLDRDEGEIFIFSLQNPKEMFLNYEDSIRNYQSNFSYYISSILLLFSFLLFYLGYGTKMKSKKNNRSKTISKRLARNR
jgi:hypothetical protein